VRRRAGQLRLTPSVVAIAALAEAIGEVCALPRFTFPLIGLYRPPSLPAGAMVAGNFSTLHLLEMSSEGERFADRARRLQRQLLSDLEHQALSGYRLMEEQRRARAPGWERAPALVANTMLEYRHPSFRTPVEAGRDSWPGRLYRA